MTVSQGSAAMSLWCENDHFVAKFVLRRAVKELRKLLNSSRSYRHE